MGPMQNVCNWLEFLRNSNTMHHTLKLACSQMQSHSTASDLYCLPTITLLPASVSNEFFFWNLGCLVEYAFFVISFYQNFHLLQFGVHMKVLLGFFLVSFFIFSLTASVDYDWKKMACSNMQRRITVSSNVLQSGLLQLYFRVCRRVQRSTGYWSQHVLVRFLKQSMRAQNLM